MSSYLRPRRGKKSTAIAQLTSSNPLKRGEIFFEVPDNGVGTGAGKIKMGDGVTAYADLPYFSDGSDVGTVLTQAQYNALTPEQKANGTYWISDASSGNIVIDNALSTTSMNAIANKPVAEAITQLNNDLATFFNREIHTTKVSINCITATSGMAPFTYTGTSLQAVRNGVILAAIPEVSGNNWLVNVEVNPNNKTIICHANGSGTIYVNVLYVTYNPFH